MTSPRAYYNEIDPFAAAWLRELIAHGHIAPGEVDERSIVDVDPADLRAFTQCHFFAGIGVWSYALRRAGWADDAPVWTGSCPCQPFSDAGKGEGADDHRHLWPAWFRLIRECAPHVVFGEQVASAAGLAWLDVVSTDLEGAGYAFGAADLCAAGVGAPHIRQRLYFVADADENGRRRSGAARVHGRWAGASGEEPATRDAHRPCRHDADGRGSAGGVGDAEELGREWGATSGREAGRRAEQPSLVGDPERARLEGHAGHGDNGHEPGRLDEGATRPAPAAGALGGFWRDAEWIPCADGKARPVEPGTFPLVTGTPARVGRLRGYGNALCAEVAIAFIEAYMSVRNRCGCGGEVMPSVGGDCLICQRCGRHHAIEVSA